MTPKITFTQTIAPEEAKNAEQSSTSTLVRGISKTDSRDMVRARIEYLLAWAERESSCTSSPF